MFLRLFFLSITNISDWQFDDDVYFVFIFFVDVAKKTRPVKRENKENNLQVIWYPNSPATEPPTKIPTALPTPKYPEPKSPWVVRVERFNILGKADLESGGVVSRSVGCEVVGGQGEGQAVPERPQQLTEEDVGGLVR